MPCLYIEFHLLNQPESTDISARTASGWRWNRANDTEETFGGIFVIEMDKVEEITAAGRKKCSASQAARAECVNVVEAIDHELA
jgi:hypothetical protein